ncbi:MAG: A/G-specific adenine glycosylase [Streptococcaceae bacterium]|jgi:A/G-specific adenine glycosylase|nr:A/G-specific adenine glycosylase [Streptococcaceae bacterium]
MNEFAQQLLTWYLTNQRHLPWRENKNPYYVWISEIMLQQTQVTTVIPYFLSFIHQFPDVESLAHADEAVLMKAWEGLGYYSRARNLQAAAKQIVCDYQGKLPKCRTELLKLKGIGPYTASAIASIAFDEITAAIDGNAFRVFSRVKMEASDIGESKSRLIFEKIGDTLISRTSPGDFNQAIMDLGAQLCTPKQPVCEYCPVAKLCLSYQYGVQLEFPKKAKKIKKKDVYLLADLVINEEGKFLFEQRSKSGVLKDMWTFPLTEVTQQVYQERKSTALLEVKHVFTHLNWYILLQIPPEVVRESSKAARWLALDDLSSYPIPKVQHKLLQGLSSDIRKNQ